MQKQNETKEKNSKTKLLYNFIKLVVFIVGCVVIIFMFPFIYPILGNCLIALGVIESIEQIQSYISIFKYFDIMLVVIAVILIIYSSNIKVGDIIDKIISKFCVTYKKGDSEIQIRQTETVIKENMAKIAKEVKEEAHDELIKGENHNNNINCKECKINDIMIERESLRYFSAYQVTNKSSRDILIYVKNEEKMKIKIFEEYMKEYYENSIRNMGKKRKQEFIERKINELLYNLRYLNIIEYTEDDEYIILTQNGKEFVRRYEEVG